MQVANNQKMNGQKIDCGTVAIDSLWGIIGGALSFGLADVTKALKLSEILKLPLKDIAALAASDTASSITVSSGIGYSGTLYNSMYKPKQATSLTTKTPSKTTAGSKRHYKMPKKTYTLPKPSSKPLEPIYFTKIIGI